VLVNADSCRTVGHSEGGLTAMVLENDAVYPGWAYGMGPPTGYIYSTEASVRAFSR
jgi:hypothetical protein